MNRKSHTRQLVLFAGKWPTWESLPAERQHAVQEVVSLLLEQVLAAREHPALEETLEKNTEKHHV